MLFKTSTSQPGGGDPERSREMINGRVDQTKNIYATQIALIFSEMFLIFDFCFKL